MYLRSVDDKHFKQHKIGRTKGCSRYNAVMESWQFAFNWGQAVAFQIRDVRARVLTDMAWVTMKTYIDMETGPFHVTNVYEFHNGQWYMVHHHSSLMFIDGEVEQQNVLGFHNDVEAGIKKVKIVVKLGVGCKCWMTSDSTLVISIGSQYEAKPNYEDLGYIMKMCIILHNMIIEDESDDSLDDEYDAPEM
ncbi:hypothetical protein HHK36_001322 [Tetracentron sinense]|uniref:SnoaL-like domain-containing protein n=1 Tax=Tetracentron sinense TaxID=13715 RepID=A0A835DRY1_TETSI|nr:hypothetical protein HHK36_001322 [Tetracentron sinense]